MGGSHRAEGRARAVFRLPDGTAGFLNVPESWACRFYWRPEPLEQFGEKIRGVSKNLANVIRDEDYAVAARSQLSAEARLPEYNIFGRSELALHHYHNTCREALGMIDP